MKDTELREMLASLERKISAALAEHVPPRPIELPSPRVPLIVGLLLGALIFAAGMFAGSFMK